MKIVLNNYFLYLSAFGTLVRMISSMTVRTWAKASSWIASSSSNINCLAWKSTPEKHVKDLFCRHITFETMTRIVFVETGPPSPTTWTRACYFWPVKVVLPPLFCIWQYLVTTKFSKLCIWSYASAKVIVLCNKLDWKGILVTYSISISNWFEGLSCSRSFIFIRMELKCHFSIAFLQIWIRCIFCYT